MEIRQLVVLAAVIEAGSLTAAAARCQRSSSWILQNLIRCRAGAEED
jgi:DNA-binding transcriptional LysR family regulator